MKISKIGEQVGRFVIKHPGKSILFLFAVALCAATLLTVSFRVWTENGRLNFELEKKELEIKRIQHGVER